MVNPGELAGNMEEEEEEDNSGKKEGIAVATMQAVIARTVDIVSASLWQCDVLSV